MLGAYLLLSFFLGRKSMSSSLMTWVTLLLRHVWVVVVVVG